MIGMRKQRKYTLLAFLVLFMSVLNLYPGAGNIEIKVTNQSEDVNKPIDDVRCLLLNGRPPSVMLQKDRTGKEGHLEFNDVDTGSYYVQFTSEKFTKNENLDHLSLPNLVGPVTLQKKTETKKISVECVEAARIKGNLSYQGDLDLSSARVFSYSGQQHGVIDKQGRFVLGGLDSDRKANVKVNILSFKDKFVPIYTKFFHVDASRLKGGQITNIGRVQFPYPKNKSSIKIKLLDNKEQELGSSDIKKLDRRLMIQSKEQSIKMSLTNPRLELLIQDGMVDIRLPAGEYRAWWKGLKEQTGRSFILPEDKSLMITMKIPDE